MFPMYRTNIETTSAGIFSGPFSGDYATGSL